MSTTLRIPRKLLEAIRTDLRRRHAFAYERVGFMTARPGKGENAGILLAANYLPVNDRDYVRDRFIGARINSDAIRKAMQHSMDQNAGIFHVHEHSHNGPPAFSEIDIEETTRLVIGLRNANNLMPHGMVLLSNDGIVADVLNPGEDDLEEIAKIRVVGWPMDFLN